MDATQDEQGGTQCSCRGLASGTAPRLERGAKRALSKEHDSEFRPRDIILQFFSLSKFPLPVSPAWLEAEDTDSTQNKQCGALASVRVRGPARGTTLLLETGSKSTFLKYPSVITNLCALSDRAHFEVQTHLSFTSAMTLRAVSVGCDSGKGLLVSARKRQEAPTSAGTEP